MKRIFTICLLIMASMQLHAQKTAILVAQFGTSYDEGRKASLDVIYNLVKTAHSDCEVRESYSSPRIRKALDKRGIHKDSPLDALLRLHIDGYDNVIVQPTFLMDGVEMNELRGIVSQVNGFFKSIKVGTPILYTVEDCQAVVDILKQRPVQKGEAVMYIGHGNEFASNAIYSMIGNMMRQQGLTNTFMGTVEGWPDLDISLAQLKGCKAKKVTLVPFLLASGVHAHEDIDGQWRPAIEKLGYQSEVYFHGLGEDPAIQQLLLKHLARLF